MKIIAPLLLALLPSIGVAQALIIDFSQPPDEATLQQMERSGTLLEKQQARAYRRMARMSTSRAQHGLPDFKQATQPTTIPTFDALLNHMQYALKETSAQLVEAHRLGDTEKQPVPLTRQPLMAEGCALAASTPSGIELRKGGLNGSRSLYRCDGFYLVAYEWDYSHPMRGNITIDASGYEKYPGTNRYKVRELSFPSSSGATETMLSWISPGYQIRLDVYTPAGRPQFSAQLDRLTMLMEAIAERQEIADSADSP